MGPFVVQSFAAAFVLAMLVASAWSGASVERGNAVLAAPPPTEQPVRAHQWFGNCCPFAYSEPGGEPLFRVNLLLSPTPVFGRSYDMQWVALRLDAIHPSLIWVQANDVLLEPAGVRLADLPIYVTHPVELFSFDSAGAIADHQTWDTELFHWRWRADGKVVAGTYGDPLLWNPADQTSRRIMDAFASTVFNQSPGWLSVSPDGRYIATGAQESPTEDGYGRSHVSITSANSLSTVRFADTGGFLLHRKHESIHDPRLIWSPDGTAVLSWPGYLPRERDGALVLHPDGSSVQLSATVRWLPDSTLMDATGQIHRTDGSLVRQISLDGLDIGFDYRGEPSAHFVSTTDMLMLAQETGGSSGWLLIDLFDGQREALPPTKGGALSYDWQTGCGWRPAKDLSSLALFHYRGSSDRCERPGDAALLYLYDSRDHSLRAVPDVRRNSWDSGLEILWSDDSSRLAVVWDDSPIYLIDTDSISATAVPRTEDDEQLYSQLDLLEWSKDGEQLMIRERLTYAALGDHPGFAATIDVSLYAAQTSRFRIVSGTTGSTLHTFHVHRESCLSNDRRIARWSLDGRSLVFAGEWSPCEPPH